MKTYALNIEGRVQGVGFRFTLQQLSLELGLSGGLFRNEYDGSVYAEISGEVENLEKFVDKLLEGKIGYAYVESVSIKRNTSLPIHTRFITR